MPTISIPKNISRTEDLIAVPRAAYAKFLAWQRRIKSKQTFVATAAERKALARAEKNFRRGKYVTLESIEHALERRR